MDYYLVMKKKTTKQNSLTYTVAVAILLVGFAAGYFAHSFAQTKPASAQKVEQAKSKIAKLFEGKTVDACWTVNKEENLGSGKYELTYRNLRINKYANRAIVSDCSDRDTLLYKNSSGEWTETTVNLQIGNRVSPTWQKECEIEDITVTDDTVRPENSSIDELNLKECKELKRR